MVCLQWQKWNLISLELDLQDEVSQKSLLTVTLKGLMRFYSFMKRMPFDAHLAALVPNSISAFVNWCLRLRHSIKSVLENTDCGRVSSKAIRLGSPC